MPLALPNFGADNVLRGAPLDLTPYTRQTLGELLLDRLKSYGSSIMFIEESTGNTVTADSLLDDILALASALQHYGIKSGDVVGISSENRAEFATAIVATLAVGATCAPLNPIYTFGELKHTMSISQPKLLFCSSLTAPLISKMKQHFPFVKTLIRFGQDHSNSQFIGFEALLRSYRATTTSFQPTKVDVMNTVAVVLCSSGTTGLPKNIVPNGSKETMLGLMPFFHGYGYSTVLAALLEKIRMVIMHQFNERPFLKAIQDHRVTLLFLVPPLVVFLDKSPLVGEYDLSTVRKIACGAAPLSKEVQLSVQKRLGLKEFHQAYGMTELTVACVFVPDIKNKMGSPGVVCDGMEFKTADLETGRPLPANKEGELCFRGPLVMRGYRNNKKATDETVDKEGWLHTGDIGYYDDEGFIFVVDRLKELIKYKGFQVAPAELEQLLLTNIGIKDAAVIGVPDDDAGEKPFAFVVRQPGSLLSAQDIQKFVASQVSPQKRLSGGVRFVEQIPKNPSGKILRRELRTLFKTTAKL